MEWLSETTPGGPVVAQMLITLLVYAGVLWKTPPTPWGVMVAGLAVVLTPWIPTFWAFGSTMAASAVGVNVVLGAFAYKTFAQRVEA